jgi:VWFA-related protein
LVLIPVTVVDGSNRPVLGLRPEQFRIFENGVEQEIRSVSLEGAPVSVEFVFDASASMRSPLDRSREAVAQFCKWADPQDDYSLVTFATRARLAVDFSPTCGTIEDRLQWVHAHGSTSLVDGAFLGLRRLKHGRNPREALLLISDGGKTPAGIRLGGR